MREWWNWPALAPAADLLHRRETFALFFQRGIWGKAHGAASDFRWIARSPSFSLAASDLYLGAEDAPRRAYLWRALGETYGAVHVYPSRAIDATGRRGFLEKQVLLWTPSGDVPAALGALVLLPQVAEWGDAIWWSRAESAQWHEEEVSLPLAEPTPLEVHSSTVEQALERALETLRQSIPSASLALLYHDLLAGRRPAVLDGLTEPLAPEALAALLLPLEAAQAASLSLAGWVPSARAAQEELARCWDVVTGSGLKRGVSTDSHTAAAQGLAEALLRGDPEMLRSHGSPAGLLHESDARVRVSGPEETAAPAIEVSRRARRAPESGWVGESGESPVDAGTWRFRAQLLDLEPPPEGAPAILRHIFSFASAPNRRWLDPTDLATRCKGKPPHFPAGSPEADLLWRWVEATAQQRPRSAHLEQWQAKVAVLRAIARVLAADAGPPSTLLGAEAVEKRWLQEWERVTGFFDLR